MNTLAINRNNSVILSLLDKNVAAKILDTGCDNGSFTIKLGEKTGSKDLWRVEILEDRAKLAEERGVKVVTGDLTKKLDFPANFFDVVHANQVIEHLYDIDNFTQEIYRVLKPGGYCIISTENLASWHNIFAILLGKQPFSTHISKIFESCGNSFGIKPGPIKKPMSMVHVKILTASSLKAIFRLHGFSRCRIRGAGYYPLPGFLANILSLLNPSHAVYITLKAYK